MDRVVAGIPEWSSSKMNDSVSIARRVHFPAPSLTVFIALQTLDILTTLLGLQMGASEGSVFLGRLMRAGPVASIGVSPGPLARGPPDLDAAALV